MTVYHIITLAIGAGMAITGALTGTSAVLIPMAGMIVGGALGHAGQPKDTAP